MFRSDIYLQVFENRLTARNLRSGRSIEVRAEPPFSHPRLLIGDFSAAEAAARRAVAAVQSRFRLLNRVLVHPMERLEGGLTQIEERVLTELALGAGAQRAVIWQGAAARRRSACAPAGPQHRLTIA